MTTVLICDDRRSVREGLTRVMSAVPGVHRIDCVAHGDELLARFSRQPVDVVLVGTQRAVPTGAEATRRLVAAHPQANVIVFGAPDDAGSIAVPTLVLVAGSDVIVDPRGAREFAAALPPGVGTLHVYDGLYHEIFNETAQDRARVLADMHAWIERTLAA